MVCDDTCELLLTRKAHRSLAVQSFYWGSTTEAHQFTRLISGSILLPLQAGHKASVLFLVWPAPALNHIVGFRYEGTQNIYFLRTPLKKTTGFCAPAELGNRPKRKRVCCDKLKKKKKPQILCSSFCLFPTLETRPPRAWFWPVECGRSAEHYPNVVLEKPSSVCSHAGSSASTACMSLSWPPGGRSM